MHDTITTTPKMNIVSSIPIYIYTYIYNTRTHVVSSCMHIYTYTYTGYIVAKKVVRVF